MTAPISETGQASPVGLLGAPEIDQARPAFNDGLNDPFRIVLEAILEPGRPDLVDHRTHCRRGGAGLSPRTWAPR